jgi:beta-lactam-binding protein with PASTA domain
MPAFVIVSLLLAAFVAPAAGDVTYTFDHIPEPGDDDQARANGAIGEAQLLVDIAPYDAGRVLFTFRNTGPEVCAITDAYFDDGSLLRIASIIDADDGAGGDAGVDFTELANPDDLPAGTYLTPPFFTTEGFSADSDPPAAQNGVDPNESLGIVFELFAGTDYDSVLNDLVSGELRIGIKVQSFEVGSSESFVNADMPPPQPVVVPDVVGMPLADANAVIIAAGLTVGPISYESDCNVPAGHVIRQDPAGGTTVDYGSSVALVVSTGQTTVPDVVGMPLPDANTAIIAAGLTVGTISYASDCSVAAGHVISQSPMGGATATCGSAVGLVVSTGQTTVPDVVGDALADANAAIIGAGLTVGTISYATAACSSAVDLVVSTGQTTVPDVVGDALADANAAIIGAGLTVGSLADANEAIIGAGLTVGTIGYIDTCVLPAGHVMNYNPLGGTMVACGSSVDMVVSTGKVEVPDLVCTTELPEATAAIIDAGLTVCTVTYEHNCNVPPGHVIGQSPVGGTRVDCGSCIDLVISTGQTVAPDVLGLPLPDANAAIITAGLTVGTIDYVSDCTVPAGYVIGQNPPGATTVDCGSPVNLVVSTGKTMVPDVLGLPLPDANAAIIAAGLTVGTISHEHNCAVPAGEVIGQNPVGGTMAECGSAVDLVVSTGQTIVPDVVGMALPDANAVIIAAGLTVGPISYEHNCAVPAGEVIGQNPVGGTMAECGSPVNLVVSTGQTVVPDIPLCGMPVIAATGAIEDAGLVVGSVTYEYDCDGNCPAGTVKRVEPASGTTIPCGSSVDLVGSLGQPVVPDVIGMTETDASAAVTAVDSLGVGSITYECNDVVAEGLVIRQDPVGGTAVLCGSSVNLVVSSGECLCTVPDVLGLSLADANAAIIGAGLTVGTISYASDCSVPAGHIISQNPVGGSTAVCGSAVDLVVSTGQTQVPDVVGMIQADANATIIGAGLTVGTITYEYSDSVAAGLVISQNPAGGTNVPCGSSVALEVSLGPCAVPELVGMSLAEATAVIAATECLELGTITYEYHDSVPADHVISQAPPAGTTGSGALGAEGDGTAASVITIDLVVSLGQPVVPDVVGMTEPDANTVITAVDALTVGSITYECSNTVAAGLVIRQDPVAGTSVPCGSSVNLVLSTGPAVVPNVVGMAEADATDAINAAGLVVGFMTPEYSDTVPAGHVISQDPAGGTAADCDSSVYLVISRGAWCECTGQTYLWTNTYPWSYLWVSPYNWDPVAGYGGPCASDTAIIRIGLDPVPPGEDPPGPIVDTDIDICRIYGPAHEATGQQTLFVIQGANLMVCHEWESHPEPPGIGTIIIGNEATVSILGRHRLADHGTIIEEVSDNADVYIGDYMKGGDSSDGRLEFTMTGGSYHVDDIMMIGDDGSGFFDLSGTANVACDRFKLQMRPAESVGELNISGGARLETFGDDFGVRICEGSGKAAMTMSGGTVISATNLQLSTGQGNATLTMTGGAIVVAEKFEVPANADANVVVEHLGGVIECGEFTHAGPYSYHLCGGILVIEGDVVDEVQAEVDKGCLHACGQQSCVNPDRICSRGDVIIEYDTPEYPGRTKVWALHMPERAWCPTPADNATGVPSLGTVLCWCPGDSTELHHVYLSTDYDAVADGTAYVTNLHGHDNTCYDPGPLLLGRTYYWRIDEQYAATIVEGRIWTFTVEQSRVVENMEPYSYAPTLIYETWIDGCGYWVGDEQMLSNGTGSCVNLWMANVHGGAKAMVYTYENVLYSLWERDNNYSEAYREFDPPLDWTSCGEKALVLWFYGDRNNYSTDMWVLLNDNISAMHVYGTYGDDPEDIKKEEWIDWNIKLSDFAAAGVDLSSVYRLSIGFGDRVGNAADDALGIMLFDDIALYPTRCVPKYATDIVDVNADCVVDIRDIMVLSRYWLEYRL